MFSKDITTSDAFREMPTSSQSLYFHLGMEADDDGFLDNYKGLMRAINASEDDLKILLAKRFLLMFPSKIAVVKHWLINNTIRKDRYAETKHLDEKRALLIKENGAYTELPAGKPSGNQTATTGMHRIGENRIEKDRKEEGGQRVVPYSTEFEKVWAVYPKKVGKGASWRAWKLLKPDTSLLEIVLAKVELYKATDQWKKDRGQFIPHFATFLNQRRFDDDPTAAFTGDVKYTGL